MIRKTLLLSAFILLTASPLLAQSSRTKSRTKGKPVDWNQLCGPTRDSISAETGLLQEWPAGGPPLVWKATGLGLGQSSVCVGGDRIFTMGQIDGKAQLIAISAKDGKILWKFPVGPTLASDQGGEGPRSTPATDGRLVWAFGPQGQIVCVSAANGRRVWVSDMRKFGAQRPGFGFCESPLLDGNILLFSAPGGGGATVVAIDKNRGRQLWKSKKVDSRGPYYTSLTVGQLGRVKQYVILTSSKVAGIFARNGQTLWEVPFKTDGNVRTVNATPVYADGHVFVSAGYNFGCMGVEVALAGSRVRVKELYTNKAIVNRQSGMVLLDGHVYGAGNNLTCVNVKTGEEVWQDRGVGAGSVLYADGHLLVRGDKGGVAWVEATPSGYKSKGQFNQPDRSDADAWAYPVLSGGKLYLRDMDVLLCYDLKAK